MRLLLKRYRHLILYIIIGSIAFSVDASIFFLLSDVLGLYYVVANLLAVFIGIQTSFYLNSKYNFKKRDKSLKRFVSFIVVCLTGMLLGTVILSFFYSTLLFGKFLSKLLSVIIAGIFQYIFNKNITFKN